MLPKRGEYMLKDLKRMAKYYQVPVHMSPDAFQHIMGTSKSLSWYFSSLALLVPVLPTSKGEFPVCSLFLNLWAAWSLCIHSHERNSWRNMAVNDTSMGDNHGSPWALLHRLWVSQDCYRGDHIVLSSHADHTCSRCCALSECSSVSPLMQAVWRPCALSQPSTWQTHSTWNPYLGSSGSAFGHRSVFYAANVLTLSVTLPVPHNSNVEFQQK